MSFSRLESPKLSPSQIDLRCRTLYSRRDFFPQDYPLVRKVAISRKIGRDYVESYAQSLEKLHRTPRIGPEAYALISLLTLTPNAYKPNLQELLHDAVELLKKGEPLTLVRTLLSDLGAKEAELRQNQAKERPLGEQHAIAAVKKNADEIRREAIADVAHKLFGYK